MTIMPARQAPFAIGAAVRFLPDPDRVEYVVECQWISLDSPPHWRLTTVWMDESGQRIRIGDAAEFVLTALRRRHRERNAAITP